ncbi:MAG: oligosaccharide flippase family protein [Clostridia bacterium]|nr:oligosaccharide flippase family protein [Clostridia bacterium]
MTITSSGIPITVSRILMKNKNENKRHYDASTITSAILTTIAISIPITLIVAFKSQWLSFLFSDERCMTILMIMIPGLSITSVYAVIRGYFWGNNYFKTYSVIELAEETVMAVVGVVLVNGATNSMQGTERAAYAVLISYVFSFVVSTIAYIIKGGKLGNPGKTLKPLLKSSIPITAMRTSNALVNSLVSVLLPARLVYYGMSASNAVAEFGKTFGMAMPMIFMPSTLIGSLALVLVPELSDDYYSGNHISLKTNLEKAIKFSCLVACVIMPVFISLGKEIGEILFSDSSAGQFIVKFSPAMLPLCLSLISSSMLNSLNKEISTLVNYSLGASALILCIYFLPSFIGVNALIVGTIINYGISSILNLLKLNSITKEKPQYFPYIFKTFLSVVPAMLLGYFIKNLLINYLPTVLTVIIDGTIILLFESVILLTFGGFDFLNIHRKNFFKGFASDKTGRKAKTRA